MLLNLSNHPSANWSEEQKTAANQQYGEIVDLPFPQVSPEGDEAYIAAIADEYSKKVEKLSSRQSITVHLMGEMTLAFALAKRLQDNGITCVASTTERIAEDDAKGGKISKFKFVRFREYGK